MNAFEDALGFVMHYEVGQWFDQYDKETQLGLCSTPEQRRKVGYVNDPLDVGGVTKYGIAQNSHPELSVKDLEWDDVKRIYYNEYWVPGQCQKLPFRLGMVHFDACVQHGVKSANKILQRAIGTDDDGEFGPASFLALNFALSKFGVVESAISERRKFYAAIVKAKPEQSRFMSGWMSRVTDLEKTVKGYP